MHRTLCLAVLLAAVPAWAQTEDFSKSITIADGTAFGCNQQLTAKLSGGATITAGGGGAASLNCAAVPDAGIIYSTKALSGEWVVSVEVSNLQYPKGTTAGSENGVTLLAIVSGAPAPGAGSSWAGKRIVGVELDNAMKDSLPDNTVFVNYWAASGEMYSWASGQWTLDWPPAFTYQPTGRYKISIEKNKTDYVIKVDGPGATVNASIAISSVLSAGGSEYLVIGDRLTDWFSGSMDIHSVTLPGTCGSNPKTDTGNIEPPRNDWGTGWQGDPKKPVGRPPPSSCDCQLSSVGDGLAAVVPVLLAFLLIRRRRRIR